ncbi:MAG TPA: zinc-binding dehydrogenase [Puia sp.]|nr:zinc-binding dehydrogenase [Puia sp.]
MKTLVLTGKNEPLVLQERANWQIAEGEALIRVHAAALNHRDVWIQKGQYAGLKYPTIPGSDGAGVVMEIGGTEGGAAKSWIGKEVIINPALNWGDHASHQDQKAFRILGLPDDGTFAEYVRVPVTSLAEKPPHLSFEEAAALPLAGVTAYRAVFTRARLKMGAEAAGAGHTTGNAGEKVLITGIGGGVALFALQYAIAAGAQVYVTSGSDEKIDKAMALGALGGVNYKKPDWVEILRSLAGSFDVTIDGAAGEGMDDLFDLASPGGRVVFYGSTQGNPSNLVARRIFWKQLDVLGTTMGSPEDFRAMISFVQKHAIRPVVDKIFPFEEGEAALRWMDDARQFGKIVIKVR